MKLTRKTIGMFLTFVLISSNSMLYAADETGKFAVKGAGKRLCSNFIEARTTKSTDYYVYAGWIEGFITGFNHFQKDNYDITPWQSTELFMNVLSHYCKQHTNVPFISASNVVLKSFYPLRLKEESKIISASNGEKMTYLYEEILLRAKHNLFLLGYATKNVQKTFDKQTIDALKKFQKDQGLTINGLPDQITLYKLFLKAKKPKTDKKAP